MVQRVSSYTDCENLEDAPDFSMLIYPVELRSIAQFEKANNISVNVYTLMGEEVKTGGKRKSNPTPTPAKSGKRRVGNADPIPKRRRCDFIDDEVEHSHSEGIDSDGEDLDGFSDDDSDVEDEGMSFYHAINQQRCETELESKEEEQEEPEEEVKPKRGLVYPLKVVNHEQERHVFTLLYTEQNGIGYYSVIINFSGLLWSQYNKHRGKAFHCYSCLHGFKAKKGEKTRDQCVLLQQHQKHCKTLKPQHVSYPKKET